MFRQWAVSACARVCGCSRKEWRQQMRVALQRAHKPRADPSPSAHAHAWELCSRVGCRRKVAAASAWHTRELCKMHGGAGTRRSSGGCGIASSPPSMEGHESTGDEAAATRPRRAPCSRDLVHNRQVSPKRDTGPAFLRCTLRGRRAAAARPRRFGSQRHAAPRRACLVACDALQRPH